MIFDVTFSSYREPNENEKSVLKIKKKHSSLQKDPMGFYRSCRPKFHDLLYEKKKVDLCGKKDLRTISGKANLR